MISSFKENNMPFNELILQKVAYKIKMDLGSDHPLYDDLPYYWYCCGPFSETLRESFVQVRKFLMPVGDCFSLKDSYIPEFKSDILDEAPEIEDTVMGLISKENYVFGDLTEDIYKQFAPLDMLHEFKYGIFNPTENNEFTDDADKYIRSFRRCQRKIIPLIFFRDFSLIFTKFTRQIDLLNDEGIVNEKWSALRKPIRNLWFTFAQGLRCLEHDSYYDNQYDGWNHVFKDSISDLDCEVDLFINQSDEWIDFSKYGELTEEERSILAPLIDIYLEDD